MNFIPFRYRSILDVILTTVGNDTLTTDALKIFVEASKTQFIQKAVKFAPISKS